LNLTKSTLDSDLAREQEHLLSPHELRDGKVWDKVILESERLDGETVENEYYRCIV
jgi:hypothetical protein